MTSHDDADITHTYATAGYEVTIDGTMETVYFNNGGDKTKLMSILTSAQLVGRASTTRLKAVPRYLGGWWDLQP